MSKTNSSHAAFRGAIRLSFRGLVAATGLFLGWSAALCVDQGWKPAAGTTAAQLESGPGEITIKEALGSCTAFLHKIGIEVPPDIPAVQRTYDPVNPAKRGEAVLVSYGSEVVFGVDLRSGVVWSFMNSRRIVSRQTPATRLGSLRLSNSIVAQTFAVGVMERIGMGKDAKLVELRCTGLGGAPDGGEQTEWPAVRARFQPMPFGFQIHDNYGRADLALDPTDGAVMEFSNRGALNPPFAVEAHTSKIKLSDAKARAAPIVAKFHLGGSRVADLSAQPAAVHAELMLVHPNGHHGGAQYDRYENPARLRLAWVLYYPQEDEVWIDAGDGSLLGGRNHLKPYYLQPRR